MWLANTLSSPARTQGSPKPERIRMLNMEDPRVPSDSYAGARRSAKFPGSPHPHSAGPFNCSSKQGTWPRVSLQKKGNLADPSVATASLIGKMRKAYAQVLRRIARRLSAVCLDPYHVGRTFGMSGHSVLTYGGCQSSRYLLLTRATVEGGGHYGTRESGDFWKKMGYGGSQHGS